MSIYQMPHAGTKLYRTRIHFKPRKDFTLTYGEVFPTVCKFVLPGDIWKVSANMLIRYKPTLAPVLTESNVFTRFFFVPLRLVIENLEEIVTGSKNGSLIGTALPVCKNFVKEYLDVAGAGSHCQVNKYSFWAALGIRPNKYVEQESGGVTYKEYQNYDAEVDNVDLPAAYVYKAYCRIIWDYFRDENYQSFDGDFEKFYDFMLCHKGYSDVSTNAWYHTTFYKNLMAGDSFAQYMGVDNFKLWFCDLRKDYFMSSLPWIMKGVQPTINSVMHADFTDAIVSTPNLAMSVIGLYGSGKQIGSGLTYIDAGTPSGTSTMTQNDPNLLTAFNKNKITDGGFTAQDIRDMFAETRVFERLARCGSRYVEYLEANFGIAPRDDTLQRPLYLGGFQQPIVTTEVVQTGGSSDGDVGTLRGHGISSGGNRIKPFVASEFGLIFGLTYVTPKTQYLYQVKKELCYKSRFDFVNPSFQNLSEQQVSSLEFFTPRLDPKTWSTEGSVSECNEFKPIPKFTLGYQGMYNELRYDNDIICRDLADTEAYWTQAINPSIDPNGYEIKTTPPLNGVNICLATYLPSLLKPFENSGNGFKPMIVDFGLNAEVFRPLVKDPIPGLTDHN